MDRFINSLNLGENLILLRRKKKVTQDELATFLNVTKASVSKWETKQSYPDILLLPQIAVYFDISIDEILGYEPQMSPEQIKKTYLELASEFTTNSFDEVFEKSENLVKKYYSCYPLLIQLVILWINHFMLTSDTEKQKSLLNKTIELCDHIYTNCSDVGICSNAVELKAAIELMLGNASKVIEELEPLMETKRSSLQSEQVLIQAYQMTGNISKANLYSQIGIYTNLLNLILSSIIMMNFQMNDKKMCEETIQRIKKIIEAYDIEHLHPNTALQFHYQVATFYCLNDNVDMALGELERFVLGSIDFIENGFFLHGDEYFNHIEEWFDEFALKTEAPRNAKLVMESLIPAIENPALSKLFNNPKYIELKNKIERKKERGQE